MRRHLAILLVVAAGCGSAKKPAAGAGDPQALHAAAFDDRLGKLATAHEHSDVDGRVRFAAFVGDTRPDVKQRSLAFRFRRLPESPDTTAPADRFVTLGATLEDAPDRPFVIAVRLPESDARGEPVKMVLARPKGSPPSRDGRRWVARLWSLGDEMLEASYRPVSLEAAVVGHKLLRSEKPPASFTSPGEGPWTLFRIAAPEEGWVALDWEGGVGEIIPKRVGLPDDLGRALSRLF